MRRPVKITTPFPTVLETAKALGVSRSDAMILSEMAERSVKTGVYAIPGVGRLVRVTRKASTGGNPKTGQSRARGVDRRNAPAEPLKIPAKKNVTFRVVKLPKNGTASKPQ